MADVIVHVEAEGVPDGYDLSGFLDALDTWMQARGVSYRVTAEKNIIVRDGRQWNP